MFSRCRRIINRKIGLSFLAIAFPFASAWIAAQAPTHVVIVHTNDIHGQILPRDGVGGLAEIATVIREAHPDLILDAGDLFTGTFLSDEFQGEPTIRILNKIGYTAATIGNHEFDYGQRALRSRIRQADFPFLSANLRTPIREIRRYDIVTAKGIRFGIIGLTTEEVVTTTHPKNLTGVTVMDVTKAIEEVLPDLRNRVDFTIITAHLTDDEERRVARAFPEIRLIIGGHNHTALGPIQAGQAVIAKTGNVGRNVGVVDLEFVGTRLTTINARLIPVKDVKPDPDIIRLITPFADKVTKKVLAQVGEATDELTNSSNAESPLADLVADAFREKGKTQIGIHNLGGIRTRIPRGPITWGRVFEVLPFPNTMITLKLTGSTLKKTLNRALLAVSGIRLRYDLKRPAGQRLVSVTLADGTAVDDQTLYSITTNDFLLAGGDGFVEFATGTEIKDTGIPLRDVVVDYIKRRRFLSPTTDGRIVIDP